MCMHHDSCGIVRRHHQYASLVLIPLSEAMLSCCWLWWLYPVVRCCDALLVALIMSLSAVSCCWRLYCGMFLDDDVF